MATATAPRSAIARRRTLLRDVEGGCDRKPITRPEEAHGADEGEDAAVVEARRLGDQGAGEGAHARERREDAAPAAAVDAGQQRGRAHGEHADDECGRSGPRGEPVGGDVARAEGHPRAGERPPGPRQRRQERRPDDRARERTRPVSVAMDPRVCGGEEARADAARQRGPETRERKLHVDRPGIRKRDEVVLAHQRAAHEEPDAGGDRARGRGGRSPRHGGTAPRSRRARPRRATRTPRPDRRSRRRRSAYGRRRRRRPASGRRVRTSRRRSVPTATRVPATRRGRPSSAPPQCGPGAGRAAGVRPA